MTKQTFIAKQDGDTLSATEWNTLTGYINTAVDQINSTTSVSAVDQTVSGGDPSVGIFVDSGSEDIGSPKVIELTKKSKGVNTTIASGNNINIEPRESTGKAKNTKGGNISFKPGDDIEFCSHHRRFGNRDEVTVKVLDGDDNPVKLQIKAGDITLSTEGKADTKAKDEDTGLDTNTLLYDDPNVMNINVTTGSGKGYLKVRAQAIDLRCEEHGGISLQPKGEDAQHNMNKIKFEHGGGDGLEFGTFNTEHTSLFTGDYRFNKNGIIRLATRATVASDKADVNDPTTQLKYVKQSDDFYDVIEQNDPTCTWGDIVTYIAWAKANNQGPWA